MSEKIQKALRKYKILSLPIIEDMEEEKALEIIDSLGKLGEISKERRKNRKK